eukprot:370667-Hanusia_phi.AAC.1
MPAAGVVTTSRGRAQAGPGPSAFPDRRTGSGGAAASRRRGPPRRAAPGRHWQWQCSRVPESDPGSPALPHWHDGGGTGTGQ